MMMSAIFAPVNGMGKQTISEYIYRVLPLAKHNASECGIPASITLAQAILESAGGTSDVARDKNNHFGIKHGKEYRRFSDVFECYRFHAEFMCLHYSRAIGKPAAHWLKYCRGYGGKDYWHHVRRIWQHYGLERYDRNTYSWKA